MKKRWKYVLLFLLVLVLSSGFCLSMNRVNNKYTAPGAQGMDGLMVLSGEELEKHDIHFLVHGWEFYPDVLLEPADFEAGAGDEYMVYTSIGERTRFDWLDDEDAHGCGTYVMNLRLPAAAADYALQLPEIYSAYRLYINGELAAQAGNPDPQAYRDATRSRIVSFEAGGSAKIILAVNNRSHFYSGLVYPPALGRSDAIVRLQGVMWCVCACMVLAGLLGAVVSLRIGMKMKRRSAGLFALLCLSAAMNSAAPLLHGFAELPVQPWYALEVFLIYIASALIVVLQNRICCADGRLAHGVEKAAFAFCALALAYGLCAARLEAAHMRLFSLLSALFKAGCAAWLMGVSLHAMLRRRIPVDALFYAAAFHAAMLAWDRILPDYEPIYGGWFAQWSMLVMILVIGCTLWQELVFAYSYSVTFAEENRQLQRQLDMQMEHARQVSACLQENQRLVHDFRHHVRTIQGMALRLCPEDESGGRNSLMNYLDELCDSKLPQGEAQIHAMCSLPAVDALLQYYSRAAANSGVSAMLQLHIPAGLGLSELEWCAVLGNLLENALEGGRRSGVQHPEMHIVSKWTGKTFFLMVENSYNGSYSRMGEAFLSGKRGNRCPGVGLESVRETIRRHGGSVEFFPMEASFRVGITLALPEE